MTSSRLLVPVAVTALAAGGLGAGGVLAVAGGGGTRTVTVEQVAGSGGAQPAVATLGETGRSAAASVAPGSEPAGAAIDVAQIYRQDGPGVVRIEQVTSSGGGLGSGFVIDRDGYIVTNAHVVDSGSQKADIYVSFSDNERVKAKVVGEDLATDIALVKVEMPASALRPIPLGSSEGVQVGDPVVAIGNPFGLDRTVTAGVVSAVSRQIDAPDNVTQIPGAIQTDAAINHGNSGGPLLDARGDVIGVNSQINTGGTGDGNVGVGFAVPIDLAKSVVAQLRAHGVARHAWLGVQISEVDATIAKRSRLAVSSGVMVEGVTPDGPAASAGLKAAKDQVYVDGRQYAVGGDIIVAIGGKKVTGFSDLRTAMLTYLPGQKVTLGVVHPDGKRADVPIVLGDLAKLQSEAQASTQGSTTP